MGSNHRRLTPSDLQSDAIDHSATLPHNPYFQATSSNGAGDQTRTDDLLITSQLLYQLSYAGLTKRYYRAFFSNVNRIFLSFSPVFLGRRLFYHHEKFVVMVINSQFFICGSHFTFNFYFFGSTGTSATVEFFSSNDARVYLSERPSA